MAQFEISLKKYGKFLNDPLGSNKLLYQEIRKAVEISAAAGLAAIIVDTPVGATGLLRQSFGISDIYGSELNLKTEIGSPLGYSVAVEEGQAPHFPPIDPLALWAQRKLGISIDMVRQVAFLIARKISKVGTKGVFMVKKAMGWIENRFILRCERAIENWLRQVD